MQNRVFIYFVCKPVAVNYFLKEHFVSAMYHDTLGRINRDKNSNKLPDQF